MAWITDSLRGAVEAAARFSPLARGGSSINGALPAAFTHQIAIAAYMSSGMARKVIAIHAEDRVREWRDWQAEADQITAIEAEEKRLGLVAKVQEAETLRGIGGGALIIITAGDHASELRPEQVAKGGIIALNVVSRWQISGRDWIKDLADPRYGWPAWFEIDGGNGQRRRIHPSRVICFRGARLPAGSAIADEEAFWGDSRLLRVYKEVMRSDETQEWFAALVRKAKLLRIGIPDLLDMMSTEDGKRQLDERIALIAQGENALNATVYRSGTGTDDPGEQITDYQVTWAGIPAVMDAFDQRVAAVSDIPFTRLTGRSPAGMNSTGEHDTANFDRSIKTGQELETRPCLEQLDPFLIRSAGVDPDGVWWKWAPLSVPSDKEETDRFKVWTEAMDNVSLSGALPQEIFNRGYQNGLIENGFMTGIEDELNKLPDDERYGLNPDDDGSDPSSLQAEEGGDPSTEARGNLPATRENARF